MKRSIILLEKLNKVLRRVIKEASQRYHDSIDAIKNRLKKTDPESVDKLLPSDFKKDKYKTWGKRSSFFPEINGEIKNVESALEQLIYLYEYDGNELILSYLEGKRERLLKNKENFKKDKDNDQLEQVENHLFVLETEHRIAIKDRTRFLHEYNTLYEEYVEDMSEMERQEKRFLES